MATPPYVDYDSNKPDGADDATDFTDDVLSSIRNMRDDIITGRVPGWAFTRSLGAGLDVARSQYFIWMNATLGIGFRADVTWTGFLATTVQYQWTNDTGATWANMGAAQVNTFDADNNITSTTNSSSAVGIMMWELLSKFALAGSVIVAHITGTGAAVHGLGSVSTQSAGAIALTGGTIDNVDIGATTPAAVDAERVRENIHDYGVIAAGGTFTPEPALYGYMKVAPHATDSNAMIIAAPLNPPSGSRTQTFVLEIIDGHRTADALFTWNAIYHWRTGAGARPLDTAFEASGSNIFSVTWNGASWDIAHAGKRG